MSLCDKFSSERLNKIQRDTARFAALEAAGVAHGAAMEAAHVLDVEGFGGEIGEIFSDDEIIDLASSLTWALENMKPRLISIANKPDTLACERLGGLVRDWRYWFKPFEKRFPQS